MSEEYDLFGEPRGHKGEPRKSGSGTGRSGLSPRPVGRPPRYGHGSFLSRVNKSVAKAHASRGTNRYSKSKPKTSRFNARGRGRKAYAGGVGPAKGWQVRDGMRYRARRVIVKARVTKLRGGNSRAAYAHLKYLQRDGADVERKVEDGLLIEQERPGRLYDAVFDDVSDTKFLERSERSFDGKGDPHQFRLIVSPEDAELVDPRGGHHGGFKYFTRDLMRQMEEDLGTRLDWVAVDHHDTAHPHTHIVVRGVTEDGKALNIAGNYIGHGIRGRAEEIATRELGLKSELQIKRDLGRLVERDRPTALDRALARKMDEARMVDLRPGVETGTPLSGITRHHLIGRAKHLSKLGLAHETGRGVWQLEAGYTDTLQNMDARTQRYRAIHRAMERHGIRRQVREHGGDEIRHPIIGKVIDKGLGADELSGRLRLVIDGADGRVHGVEVAGDTRSLYYKIAFFWEGGLPVWVL